MIRTTLLLINLLFFFCSTYANNLPTAVGSDATQWLAKADTYMMAPNSELMLQVKLFKEKKLSKTRNYTVFTQEPRKSIVLFESLSENGQKVLMKGHNFWLFLPRSKRGIRITAQQKLFGDAATGDITTIRWSEDYMGNITACDENNCSLDLIKKRRGPTYQKIKLYVDKHSALPVRSELYLNKNKIAKTAQYTFKNIRKAPFHQIDQVTYQNRINQSQHTRVLFLTIKNRKTPKKWYNPSFLASKPTLR